MGTKKPRLWALLLVLAALCLFASLYTSVTSRGIFVQGQSREAGLTKSGAIVPFPVHLVNLSWRPVTVTAIPTCGCTVAETTQVRLAPLKSMTLQAHIDTKNMGPGRQKRGMILMFEAGQDLWQEKASVRFSLD